MARQNYINELPNLGYSHKENMFNVEVDENDQYFYDLSETIYDFTEDFNVDLYNYHYVTNNDNFFSLAMKYFEDKSLWWVIASLNNYDNPFTLRNDVGKKIKIPRRRLLSEIIGEVNG